ncbi:DUF2938 family protein [Psychromonas sp. B3M02]|uniref:DUF2938 family protein n=1 Tax=Psychromonas sp. B3M02 TaxID=2267226 RepID=UPI001C6922EF|nr:DUF2938 family protein [Psychromonas sp. B3M02]
MIAKAQQIKHDSIAASKAKLGEKTLGWFVHYLTGIVYALLLVVFYGQTNLSHITSTVTSLIDWIGYRSCSIFYYATRHECWHCIIEDSIFNTIIVI